MRTSAVSAKSTSGLRSCSAVSGIAARSSARTSFREPLKARPIGVRTASTMTASGICGSFSNLIAPGGRTPRGSLPRRSHSTGGPGTIPERRRSPTAAPTVRRYSVGRGGQETGIRSVLMTMRSLLLGAVCLLLAAAPASADLFANPSRLPNGDPNAHPYFSGGEPSIAFDPAGDGHVYVTAPQRIPTAAGGGQVTGDPTTGIGFWASGDHGASFGAPVATGASNGGGDTDVEVLQDHSVLAADLEAAATDICTSHEFGKTFQDCDGVIAKNQQGPENDREWLTRGAKPGEVYLTYHDFAGGFPIIEKSTDGGQNFVPCGTIIDPNGPAAQNYTPAGGTLVSKPIVGPDGTIYVEFTTPDQTAAPVGATLNHLYMGVAKGGCDSTTVFTDHLIYEKAGASLGSIFQQTARDGGGQLYVLAAGKTVPSQTASGLWLFTSSDGGTSWSAPKAVNPPAVKGNVFPTIAGGQAKGEALLGWFGTTTSGDPNTGTNQWDFYSAATYDGSQTFATSKVTDSPI